MVVSYPATSLLGSRPPFNPPSTHTTLPWTVLATSWRAVGASRRVVHGDDELAAPAEVAGPAGVNGSTSAMFVDTPWLGTWAPSMANTELPIAATARPWRGVRMGGRPDHWRLLMSKDSTVGNMAVELSP